MAVKLTANIEEDYIGGWFIRLTDTLSEESIICENLNNFSEKIEEFGLKYAKDIEVVWSKNSDLTPEHFSEVYHAIEQIKVKMGEDI